MYERWGKSGNLPFREAYARGEVEEAEVRAVRLLSEICDAYRVSIYLSTGYLPVRGNLTGRTYLLKKGGGAIEFDCGLSVASWCINVAASLFEHRANIPPTDHVNALRCLIEGEEHAFLREGNRSDWASVQPHGLSAIPNPFAEPILDPCSAEEMRLKRIGLDDIMNFDAQLMDLEKLGNGGDILEDPLTRQPQGQNQAELQLIGFGQYGQDFFYNQSTLTNATAASTNLYYNRGQAAFGLAT